ncbi:hypothetical protein FACS189451_11260 [Bacteroidia bacterium]|nr:hypothetical protein FACS189451_11260 [Bacteroidia bacterium]
MMVYNTNASVGAGVYYWDTNKWIKVSDGTFIEVDGVIGNEIVDATANGGLERAGSGTAAAPYTLGIASEGITTAMLGDGSVTPSKLASPAQPFSIYEFDGTDWTTVRIGVSASSNSVFCWDCVPAAVGSSIRVLITDSAWFKTSLYKCSWAVSANGADTRYYINALWNGFTFNKFAAGDNVPLITVSCPERIN